MSVSMNKLAKATEEFLATLEAVRISRRSHFEKTPSRVDIVCQC